MKTEYIVIRVFPRVDRGGGHQKIYGSRGQMEEAFNNEGGGGAFNNNNVRRHESVWGRGVPVNNNSFRCP